MLTNIIKSKIILLVYLGISFFFCDTTDDIIISTKITKYVKSLLFIIIIN